MERLIQEAYDKGDLKTISPLPSHYTPRTEINLGMTAKAFYDAMQMKPLSEILPEVVRSGEIIEIDDGLRSYFFYVQYSTAQPLSYFKMQT